MSATEATLLVVSSDPRFGEQTRRALQNAAGQNGPRLVLQTLRSAEEVPAAIAKQATPHVIAFDIRNPGDDERRRMKPILNGLRDLDPGVCVFIMATEIPAAMDTMGWLDDGATGLLHRDFDGQRMSEPLLDVFSKRLKFQVERSARSAARHKIHIRLASLEQALVAETLNVGLGGMFVRMVPPDVNVGDTVDFEFEISNQVSGGDPITDMNPLVRKVEEVRASGNSPAAGTSIRGTGVIMWIRPSSDRILPEGIGLQFLDLTETTRKWIEQFVATHRIRAFIPKS